MPRSVVISEWVQKIEKEKKSRGKGRRERKVMVEQIRDLNYSVDVEEWDNYLSIQSTDSISMKI